MSVGSYKNSWKEGDPTARSSTQEIEGPAQLRRATFINKKGTRTGNPLISYNYEHSISATYRTLMANVKSHTHDKGLVFLFYAQVSLLLLPCTLINSNEVAPEHSGTSQITGSQQ